MEFQEEPYGLHVDRRVAPFIAAGILGVLAQAFPGLQGQSFAPLLVGALLVLAGALLLGALRGFPRPVNSAIACLGLALALWPWAGPEPTLRAGVAAAVVALCIALHYLPWRRLPVRLRLLVPGGAVVCIGLFALAGGSPPWLVFPLLLLAVLWTALGHGTRDLVLVTALAVAVQVLATAGHPQWLVQTPLYAGLLVLVGASTHALVRRTRQAAVGAAAVAEVLRALVEGGESGSIRQSLCSKLSELLGGSNVTLFELDAEAQQLVPTAAVPRLPPIKVALDGEVFGPGGASYGTPDPPAAILEAFRTGRPTFRASLPALKRTGVLREQEELAGVRSTYCQPVLRDGRSVAVLSITWRRALPQVQPDQARLVAQLADEVGVLLAQADLRGQVEALARTDSLTEVANRRHWESELALAMSRTRREHGPLCVAVVDLDHFKAVNDDLGHAAGDRLLHSVAARWAGGLRQLDVLGRYGGDEFGLILPSCEVEEALDVIERLRSLTADDAPFSAGVALWNGLETDADLLQRADGALYDAKRAGGGISRVAEDRTAISESWVTALHATLDGGPISIAFQPIKRLADGTVVGWEALARFEGLGESVEPLFLAARRLGVSRDLDWRCQETAIAQASGLGEPIFLNTSVWSLLDGRHPPEELSRLVEAAGRRPGAVVLELSENDRLGDPRVAEAVRTYRRCGFRFGLDDVGVGHSTFEMLIAIEASFFKVTPALLQAPGARSRAAVSALTHFAQHTGAEVIAEGLENEQQVKKALEAGVELGQGYLLGRPAPAIKRPLPSPAPR